MDQIIVFIIGALWGLLLIIFINSIFKFLDRNKHNTYEKMFGPKTKTEAIIIINDNGKVINVNDIACAMFKTNSSNFIGKYLHETIIPERYREAHLKGLKMAKMYGPKLIGKSLALHAKDFNGEEFPVVITLVGWQDDKTQRWLFAASIRKQQYEVV